MKNLYLRSMLAAACAVTLAACGGSGGNLYLQGHSHPTWQKTA